MTIERAKAIYDAARRAGELKSRYDEMPWNLQSGAWVRRNANGSMKVVVTENGATEIALGRWGAP